MVQDIATIRVERGRLASVERLQGGCTDVFALLIPLVHVPIDDCRRKVAVFSVCVVKRSCHDGIVAQNRAMPTSAMETTGVVLVQNLLAYTCKPIVSRLVWSAHLDLT